MFRVCLAVRETGHMCILQIYKQETAHKNLEEILNIGSSGWVAKVPDFGGEIPGSIPAITWLKITSLLRLLYWR